MNVLREVGNFLFENGRALADMAIAQAAVERLSQQIDRVTEGLNLVSLQVRSFAERNRALNAVASAIAGVNTTAISSYLTSEAVKGSLIAALKKDALVIYRILPENWLPRFLPRPAGAPDPDDREVALTLAGGLKLENRHLKVVRNILSQFDPQNRPNPQPGDVNLQLQAGDAFTAIDFLQGMSQRTTLADFRNMVENTGFFGGGPKVLDGELMLNENGTGLVKTNYGGTLRRIFSKEARRVLSSRGTDAQANFEIRRWFAQQLLNDLREKIRAGNEAQAGQNGIREWDEGCAAISSLKNWIGGILGLDISRLEDEHYQRDGDVPPLDRRTVKRIFEGYDAFLRRPPESNKSIALSDEAWRIDRDENETRRFNYLTLTKTMFDAMVDRSLGQACTYRDAAGTVHSVSDDLRRQFEDAARLIKSWRTEHADDPDALRFNFRKLMQGSLDERTVARYIKRLAYETKGFRVTAEAEDDGLRPEVYDQATTDRISRRNAAIRGAPGQPALGAYGFSRKVDVCLASSKAPKAGIPLGGRQRVLDFAADLFANEDLEVFGQGGVTNGERLLRTFAKHHELFAKLLRDTHNAQGAPRDPDAVFFYRVIDDLVRGLPQDDEATRPLGECLKAAFTEIENEIRNGREGDRDTLDLIAINTDSVARCAKSLEDKISQIARLKTRSFGSMIADRLCPSPSAGGYEAFASLLLKAYVDKISEPPEVPAGRGGGGPQAPAATRMPGGVADCRLIVANAIRDSRELDGRRNGASRVVQFRGFLRGLGPGMVKLLQNVAEKNIRDLDGDRPVLGSLTEALRDLRDDMPSITKTLLEAELYDVFTAYGRRPEENNPNVRITSIKVEKVLGSASVGETVKAKITFVRDNPPETVTADAAIKFIRPEVPPRFRREQAIFSRLREDMAGKPGNGALEAQFENWQERMMTCGRELDLKEEARNVTKGNAIYGNYPHDDLGVTRVLIDTGLSSCLIMEQNGEQTLSRAQKAVSDLCRDCIGEKHFSYHYVGPFQNTRLAGTSVADCLRIFHSAKRDERERKPDGDQFFAGVRREVKRMRAASRALKALTGQWVRGAFEKDDRRESFFHGDLHPGNLMIGDTGKITLIDFGNVGTFGSSDKCRKYAAFLKPLLQMCSADHPISTFQTEYEKARGKAKGKDRDGDDWPSIGNAFAGRTDPELPKVFLERFCELLGDDGEAVKKLTGAMDGVGGLKLKAELFEIFQTKEGALWKIARALSLVRSKGVGIPVDLFGFLEAGQRLHKSVIGVQDALAQLKCVCLRYGIFDDIGECKKRNGEDLGRLDETTWPELDYGDEWRFDEALGDSLEPESDGEEIVSPRNRLNGRTAPVVEPVEEEIVSSRPDPRIDRRKLDETVEVMTGKFYLEHPDAPEKNFKSIREKFEAMICEDMVAKYKHPGYSCVRESHLNRMPKTFGDLTGVLQRREFAAYFGRENPIGWDPTFCWVASTSPLKYAAYSRRIAGEFNLNHAIDATIAYLRGKLNLLKDYAQDGYRRQPEDIRSWHNQTWWRFVELMQEYVEARFDNLSNGETDKERAEWKGFEDEVSDWYNLCLKPHGDWEKKPSQSVTASLDYLLPSLETDFKETAEEKHRPNLKVKRYTWKNKTEGKFILYFETHIASILKKDKKQMSKGEAEDARSALMGMTGALAERFRHEYGVDSFA